MSDVSISADAAPAEAAATAQTTAAPVKDAGLTPPASLLNDKQPEAQEAVKKDEPAVEEKPIEYEPFKLPDGVTLDQPKMDAFTEAAKQAKIPQEVAQKFVDMYSAEVKAISEAPMRAWTEMQNKWQAEVRNDPVIGGANLDKNLAATKEGLKALLGEDAPKFFEALNITGAGNNPDVIRGLFKAAQAHAPATPVAGNPGAGAKTAASTLYPKMAGYGSGNEG